MKKVILKQRYKGLAEGTELYYNPALDSFGFSNVDENISDNMVTKSSQNVSFSRSFVEKFLNQLFEDVDNFFKLREEVEPEAVEVEEKSYLKELKEKLEKLEKEMNELKPKTRKTKK